MPKPARPARKLAIEETPTGYPPFEDAIIREVVAQFRQTLVEQWPFIQEVRESSDENTVAFSFGCKVNTASKKPIVTGKLAFAKRWTAESEGWVDHPDQPSLPFATTTGA
jgi:hypothetical protein